MKHPGNTLKKLVALLLCACMGLLLTACNRNDGSTGTTKEDTRKPAGVAEGTDLILPYSREEGVNPFSGTSLMNEAVMPLIYDGLYRIDEHYEPSMVLVESIVENGTTLMLTMNSERRFSDGSVITADDVAYSFKMAKNSVYYGSMLKSISSATAGGTTTISFTLEKPNKYVTANLTFPIVKEGTADTKDSIPVGSGRYVYSNSDSGGVLKKSDQYSGEKFKAEQIFLLNIADNKALLSSLNIETVNAAVDDISDGELDRITASTTQMPLNNLVFVGIRERDKLADASLRQAINAVIDRKKLISTGLSGYGEESELPLNPEWYGAQEVKIQSMDVTKAKDLLQTELAGQTLKIVVTDSNPFHGLLADELAKELKSAGVSCEVEAAAPAVYRSAISSGLYDLYIGEYRLPNDMDISGVLSDSQLKSSWESVESGASTCEAFVKAFYKQMPFVTIGFRTGVLAYSRNMEKDVKPLPGNPYANVYEWVLS